MSLQVFILGSSLALTLLFFLYGFNHYYLLRASRRYKPPLLPDLAEKKPRVVIHLPVYNEKYVIQRLVDACADMVDTYGAENARVLVIDDSDDDTVALIDEIARCYGTRGLRIEVMRRPERQGFKGGALAYALDDAEEEFVAIFDADFIPSKDFLVETIPYFIENEQVGVIQSRWAHLNRNYNLLTRAIAIGIDVHFFVDQPGRYEAGCFQNFNGSGGIFRKKALQEAGGWQTDTLAEDLDVSYRIQLLGYKIIYLKNLQTPGEVPPTVPSFKKQQGRWACGSLRTARKILPKLLADRRLGFKLRLEAFLHLTGYMVHPMMFFSFLLACLATLLKVDTFQLAQATVDLLTTSYSSGSPQPVILIFRNLTWSLVVLLIGLCTVAAWISPAVSLKAQGLSVVKNLSSLMVLFLLGFGLSLSNSVEAGKALFSNKVWDFKRTPKYAIQHNQGEWRDKKYQVPLDYVCFLELTLACLGLISIGSAVWRSNFPILLILIPYTAAYSFVCILTILQSRGTARL